MYAKICDWENLRLAHRKAARGKRGKRAAATFEYNLADHLRGWGCEPAGLCSFSPMALASGLEVRG